MANGSFHGQLSPYTFDHTEAYNQQRHAEEKAEEARILRAQQWLAKHLNGQTFTSYEQMVNAACRVIVVLYGRALREDEHLVIAAAARLIWTGFVTPGTVNYVGQWAPRTVTFRAA